MSTPPAPNPNPTPAPTPTPTANPPASPPPPATSPTGQDPAAEIARLTKELAAARKEAGAARVTAKENAAREAREALLKQLSGDAPEVLTPEQLTQQLAEARTQGTTAQEAAAAAAIELTVFRTALKLGANAEALLDSRQFCDGIDAIDVDPTDRAAFTAAVTERVNAALAANPALRATHGASQSGTAHTPSGAAGTPPTRPTSLNQAVSRRLGRG